MINILLKIKSEKIVFLLFVFVMTFSVTILSGCSDYRYPDALIAADSIADRNPKKAINILDSIRPQIIGSDKAEKNYYDLLRIKANDKAYVRHTSDTTILRLVGYYEKGGDKKLLPMAYYYAGRVYRDLQDAPRALDYFQKAEDFIKGNDPKNIKLLRLIYAQVGTILTYQGFYREAFEMLLKEHDLNVAMADTTNLVYNYRDMGEVYWDFDKLDSALYCYKKADELAVMKGDKNLSADIKEQMAALYIYMGNTDAASKCLSSAAPYTNPINIGPNLSIYADLYEKTGQTDSAFSCYQKLLSVGNIYGKQGAYKGLTEYYLDKGNKKEAKKFLNLYMQATDSIKKINVSDAVAGALAMYNYRLHEKEVYELKIKNQQENEQKILLSLVSLFIVAVSSFLVLWYKRKNKLMKSEKENMELREKNRIFEEQRLKENKILQIKSSDIYKTIKNINSDQPDTPAGLTDADWKELEKTVNGIYENFETKLHDITGEVSLHEYRVCLLIKTGIRPANIASLTNHSKEAINSTRKRLYEKSFNKKGRPADWDDTIRSL